MRHRANVFYNHDDICPIGEYQGKLNVNGFVVFFKTKDGKHLKWYTIIQPSKYNSVEHYWGRSVDITYEEVEQDVNGLVIIKNVRFLK